MTDFSEYIDSFLEFLNNFNPLAAAETSVKRTVHEALMELGFLEGPFVQLAGASGALAVFIGMYGSYGMQNKSADAKLIFETGMRYHLLHSIVLFATPLSRNRELTCALLGTGIVLFSGSCYYTALTGRTHLRWAAPFGGISLLLGWASFIVSTEYIWNKFT